MEPQTFPTAFVPFDGTPFDQRAALAIRWIVQRERESGHTASLILPDKIDYPEPIRSFKSGRPWSSLRSRKALGIGPVLVMSTGMEGLEKAKRFGQDRGIAYVASSYDYWIDGWAATVGAVDLRSGRRALSPSGRIRELLGDLDRAGNNGWYAQGLYEGIRLILSQLDKHVSRHFIAGAMLAHEHSVKSVRSLLGPV
jgi:hypothetical protein